MSLTKEFTAEVKFIYPLNPPILELDSPQLGAEFKVNLSELNLSDHEIQELLQSSFVTGQYTTLLAPPQDDEDAGLMGMQGVEYRIDTIEPYSI